MDERRKTTNLRGSERKRTQSDWRHMRTGVSESGRGGEVQYRFEVSTKIKALWEVSERCKGPKWVAVDKSRC
jgi:hypothetical protein